MNKLGMGFALECQGRFIIEKRSQTYEWYVWGVSQMKIVPGAKNSLQTRALLGLERNGA